MDEQYFVISSSEDGLYMECMTKADFLNRLAENYYGEKVSFRTYMEAASFVNGESLYENELVIIRGKLIKPFEKKVVTEYDME